MLSAHQPYESYPARIKQRARTLGSMAQVAGGVPAMCDGVTQGRPGMELSLLSRDVIALSTAVALSHNVYDATVCLGICDKIVPGLLMKHFLSDIYQQYSYRLVLCQQVSVMMRKRRSERRLLRGSRTGCTPCI